MRKSVEGKTVVRLAVFKNFFNILHYYPRMVSMYHHPEKYTEEEKFKYNNKLINILLKTCKTEVTVYGRENLSDDENYFLCSNHQGKFDPLIIWKTFDRPLSVIVDIAAVNKPIIKELCGIYTSYYYDRTNIRHTLTESKRLEKGLLAGESCMAFPEGNYEDDNESLMRFKPGCFRAAIRTGTTIVPVVLSGVGRVFEKGKKPPYEVSIRYLEPITKEQYKGMNSYEISELVQKRVQDALDEYGC